MIFKMFSHHTIKLTMLFVMAVVLVNLINYIFYVYYNPSNEALWVNRRPIATEMSDLGTSLKFTDQDHPGANPKMSNVKMENMELCPEIPSGLGPVPDNVSIFDLPKENSDSTTDSYNKIITCVPRERVAIIMPISSSAEFPHESINYLNWFLSKQLLEYQIFVVKQSTSTSVFHRGALINAAFSTLHKMLNKPFTCFIIHEPAVLPLDTRNMYRCSWYPRQLVATIEKDKKVKLYEHSFGGAVALTADQMVKANGFSNLYNDDNGVLLDMAKRLTAVSYIIEKAPQNIGNYIISSYSIDKRTDGVDIESPTTPTAQNSSQSDLKDGLTSLSYYVEQYKQRAFVYLLISLRNIKEPATTLLEDAKKIAPAPIEDSHGLGWAEMS